MKLTHWNWVAVAVTVGSAVAVGLGGCSSNSSSSNGKDGGTSSSSSGSSSGSTSSSGSGSGSGSSSGSGSGSGSSSGGSDGGSDAGAAVEIVPVGFSLTNFTLFAPGDPGCPDNSNNCGHIHLLIDGTACGTPYNNAITSGAGPADGGIGTGTPSVSIGSPANMAMVTAQVADGGTDSDAIVSKCPMANGMHTITLELHHNDHSPVQVNGTTVSAKVQVTVSGG